MERIKKVQWLWAVFVLASAGLGIGVWRLEAGKGSPSSSVQVPGWITGIPGPVLSLASPRSAGAPLYAGTARGLYRSADGRNWSRVFTGGAWPRPVRVIGIEPASAERVWIGAGSRFYLSSDGGSHWKPGLRVSGEILCSTQDPADPSRFLIGTTGGLYESRDGGRTCRRVPALGSVRQVSMLLMDAGRPGLCFLLSGGGLFRSGDGGRTWSRETILPPSAKTGAEEEASSSEEPPDEDLPEDLPPTGADFFPAMLAMDPSANLLYASTAGGIFRSGDGGRAWEPLPLEGMSGSGPADQILVHPARPGELFALRGSRLSAYSDARGGWRESGNLPEGQVYGLRWGEGDSLWVGTEQGLFHILLKEEAVSVKAAESSREPTIQQVHRVAIAYAEVGPEKVRRWRGLARMRAFIPSFTVGLDQDRDTNVVSSTAAGVTKFTAGPDRLTRSVDFGFTWDLGDFLWSSDQTSIDVRSRLTTQLRQDLLEETTRLYFERKRLLAEFEAQPAEEPVLRRERQLRIAEVTAYLDALTGGWFSKQLD